MLHKFVYLAGPIKGLDYGSANDWRDYAREKLAEGDSEIIGVSPMRAKEFLRKIEVLDGGKPLDNHLEEIIAGQRGLTARDCFDCDTCDVFFANLLGADKVSIGTIFEIGRVSHRIPKVPIITVMEKQGNPNDHAMIREATNYRVETLDEGIVVARSILIY